MSDKWLESYQKTAAASDLIAMKKKLESIVAVLLDSTHDIKSMLKASSEASSGLHALLRIAIKDEEIENEQYGSGDE